MASDVLIIGAGPVGLTAALLLARHGLRITIVERRREPVPAPRAVALDDEGLRIWQSCGLGQLLREDWASGEPDQCICTYLDERGHPFLRIHQRTGEFGHPHAVAIHQGRIEEKLMRAAEQSSRIKLHRGSRVQNIQQNEQAVTVSVVGPDGQPLECNAPWAIACDGGGSTVRECLGIPMVGSDLPHPWLVVNLEDLGEPGHVTIRCRKRAAAVTMPIPHGLRRVEVQLDKDDAGAWLNNDAEVRARLRLGWEGAVDAPIVTRAICRFRAVVAATWRDRRVFLAGDAAHLMPPFAGQGLGAGLRDVSNLSFKIAGVCQGWLAPAVLDSYEQERRPHLERMTRLACHLGRLMSPRSLTEAALVPAALRMVGASPALCGRWLLRGPSIQQTFTSGFMVPSEGAGRYLPQPIVIASDNRRVALDELLGPRMTWIVLSGRSGDPPRLVPPLLQPSDTVLMEGRDFRDPDHVLRERYGHGGLVLVRPDRVVYFNLRSSRYRSTHGRSLACRSDSMSLREVRHVASSVARSWPFPSPDASPTARTRAS